MNDAGKIAVQSQYLNHEISMKVYEYQPHIWAAWVCASFVTLSEGLNNYMVQRRYNERWRESFDDCYNEPPPVLHRGGIEDCGKWRKFRNVVVSQIRREVAIFSCFDSIVEGAKHYPKDCRHCYIRADKWIDKVNGQSRRVENMPEFTSFL